MSYFPTINIGFADTGAVDSFQRLRIGSPEGLFDSQFTYNLNTLIYEQITSGSGATITHDTTNRMAIMTFSSTPTGGKAYMQSYEYIPYQPGRSQLIYMTFLMGSGVSNVLKFAGYSDGTNGIEFQMNGTTPQFVILSGTGSGNETATQSNWNLDKLDGSGKSGFTLDTSKVQILVIDLQALYTGRVRVGFNINGVDVFVHQFLHSNSITTPYIQTANLPVRCGMTCTGTVSTTCNFICASVMSEGGVVEIVGRGFSAEGSGTAGSGTRTHLLSVRPKTTFNSITNRIRFELDTLNAVVTQNNAVLYELVLGQAISGTTTFSDVNSSYSGFEFNTAGTISGSPAVVISSFYCGPNGGAGAIIKHVDMHYPISLDASGAVRSLGTISVLGTGIGAGSNCRITMNWREIR